MTILDASSVEYWAMQKSYLDRMAAIAIAKPEQLQSIADRERERTLPSFVRTPVGYDYMVGKAPGKSGLIAIVPISGVMSRYGNWCSWGSESIASWVAEAANDADITGVVIQLDTGGGDASGIELIDTAVRYCKEKKPVLGHVINSYSGGVWAMAHCTEIMMESHTVGGTGSIGVYSTHLDYVEKFKQEGINYEIIRAKGSENKALNNAVELLTDEARENIRSKVTKLRDTFITTVKSGRKKIDDSVFDGAEFNGDEALKVGLIDSFGLLGDAIERVDKLAKTA